MKRRKEKEKGYSYRRYFFPFSVFFFLPFYFRLFFAFFPLFIDQTEYLSMIQSGIFSARPVSVLTIV